MKDNINNIKKSTIEKIFEVENNAVSGNKQSNGNFTKTPHRE